MFGLEIETVNIRPRARCLQHWVIALLHLDVYKVFIVLGGKHHVAPVTKDLEVAWYKSSQITPVMIAHVISLRISKD